MAVAVHERRVRVLEFDQLFLVDICEAGVVGDEIWVLFVVYSLNFPSRLYAGGAFEFWT